MKKVKPQYFSKEPQHKLYVTSTDVQNLKRSSNTEKFEKHTDQESDDREQLVTLQKAAVTYHLRNKLHLVGLPCSQIIPDRELMVNEIFGRPDAAEIHLEPQIQPHILIQALPPVPWKNIVAFIGENESNAVAHTWERARVQLVLICSSKTDMFKWQGSWSSIMRVKGDTTSGQVPGRPKYHKIQGN